MVHQVSFPGLGIDLIINRVAFSIGGFTVYWYSILIALGLMLGFAYFYFRCVKNEAVIPDKVYNIALITVPVAVLGARFVYVITSLDEFDTFLEMISIWNGGIAIYGAVIFGLLAIILYTRKAKLKTLGVLDAAAPAVMIGQIIGRWGNFFNCEAYGWSQNIENLPWRMVIKQDGVFDMADGAGKTVASVHPTFLYESLWNLLGFVLINLVYKKKKTNGVVFFFYIGWYGIGRAAIEMLRTDSLYIFGSNIKFSVVVGLLSFAASIIGIYIVSRRGEKEQTELSGYESKFKGVKLETLDSPVVVDTKTKTEEESENEQDSNETEASEEIEKEEKDGDSN